MNSSPTVLVPGFWLGGWAWDETPTSHWPMWSRPRELARVLGEVASGG